jgi:polyhydroxybutyrate depolymerase
VTSGRLASRLRTLLLALSAACVAGCASVFGARPLATARAGVTSFHTIDVAGRHRSFLLHVPPSYRPGHPLPLVLVMHGHMGNANAAMDVTGMNAEADRRGFVVAYPNGTGALRYAFLSWNAATCCGSSHESRVDDVAFADSLAAALVRAGLADSERVYAAGFSAGGMLALRLACERAATCAAVADVAGTMPDTACAPGRAVSVVFFQGEEDDELRFDLRTLRREHGHRFAESLENALQFWARHDGCGPVSERDSTASYTLERARCPGSHEVELYTVRGNPHAWPGGAPSWAFAPRPVRSVSASAIILDFFARQPADTAAEAPARGGAASTRSAIHR